MEFFLAAVVESAQALNAPTQTPPKIFFCSALFWEAQKRRFSERRNVKLVVMRVGSVVSTFVDM